MSTGLAVTILAITNIGKIWPDENGSPPVDLTTITISQPGSSVAIPAGAALLVANALQAGSGSVSVTSPASQTITVSTSNGTITIANSLGGSASFPSAEASQVATLVAVRGRMALGEMAYTDPSGNVRS